MNWNWVFREKNAAGVPVGDYSYRCYVLVGTLKDVTNTMTALYQRVVRENEDKNCN